jgi:signal transduction histidine kinase
MDAVLAVSRTATLGGDLESILGRVAYEAAELAGAEFASIVLRGVNDRLRFGGTWGLSQRYRRFFEQLPPGIELVATPTGLALECNATVTFEDVETDPRIVPLRAFARQEGYRSTVSIPLMFDSVALGTLNVYRSRSGPWLRRDLEPLEVLAGHAAVAVRTAQLLDQQQSQVAALTGIIRALREQTHEHANRIHTISGLLSLGDAQAACDFVAELESTYHSNDVAAADRVLHPILAGLVIAEATVARQRGIKLRLDRRSRLERLPASISATDAVTLVGNLIQNGFDAVAQLPSSRRRITLLLQDVDGLVVRVRDWGMGLPAECGGRVFERGFSTKLDHEGLGLALVAQIVTRTGGTVAVEHFEQGIAITVRIPDA